MVYYFEPRKHSSSAKEEKIMLKKNDTSTSLLPTIPTQGVLISIQGSDLHVSVLYSGGYCLDYSSVQSVIVRSPSDKIEWGINKEIT